MNRSLLTAVARGASIRAADVALSSAPVRKLALAWGEKALHDFYCVKRFEGLPLGVQELRHKTVMNMLRSLDRAVADGRVSSRARRGVLEGLVANTIAGARKNIRQFVVRHGYEPPAFLVISPTQRCNLFCKGCYAASSGKTTATLAYDTFCRVLEDKRDDWGSHFTAISGGEPLMYRSQERTILDVFARFPDTYFLMFTNGTLIDDAMARRLADLGNVTPAISIEGFERETDARRGAGVFRKIERAMDALRRAGVPFGISITATRDNADLVLSEELIRHYVDEKGAIYAWMFHYMPIGRSFTLDLMPTPEQRRRMLERQLVLLRERGLFFIDFWNGGAMSGGCISAGRSGGFFYVDWNGDVSPCVFVPYAVDNVYDIYRNHRTLSSALDQPVFKAMREWQLAYTGRDGKGPTRNLFVPCPMRDHHEVVRTRSSGSARGR
jgi:MoaA/NifB/PqqE/SkfB family radical SAM enzyme